MKTLYLDCGMGAAGDMLTAALIELFPDPQNKLNELNALGLPDIHFSMERSIKCGITGTHITVTVQGAEEGAEVHGHEHGHPHDHDGHYAHAHDGSTHIHHGMTDIEHIIRDHLAIPDDIKNDIIHVFKRIAEAESHVHGVPISDIHFHEVGTMDAVADITAVCYLMHELSPDEVIASPIHMGAGHVKCAHGILPVPAPATAYILQGIPAYGGEIQGELCTPTGAALLKHFVSRYGKMPVMKTTAIGYGMGKKDFETANCIRAMFGETQNAADSVIELSCNVDDMTAEAMGYAMEKLLERGALDVYTIPIGMKKSRPGTMICVLCHPGNRSEIVELLFKHTSTIGVREAVLDRYVLSREITTLNTPYGPVRRKTSSGYGVNRVKYEYNDIARIADSQGISLKDAEALLRDLESKSKG